MAPRIGPAELVDGTLAGDRSSLARLITLIERGGPSIREVMKQLYRHTGRAYAVGITGAPGAGKSTLTDRLIGMVRALGEEVGVLAVDPSSPFSGGAILGDRVRMQDHSTDPGVFIRSMATRGHLGGLALATPEAVRAIDAAGKPWILVETVGVGQVEIDVAGAADSTLVVVNPGWGDGVQAAKAGLLEVADIFVVNKADRPGVAETVRDLETSLDLSGKTTDLSAGTWRPPVISCVATTLRGVDDVWAAVAGHRRFLEETGGLSRRRDARLRREVRTIVNVELARRAEERCGGERFDRVASEVAAHRLDPYEGAEALLGDDWAQSGSSDLGRCPETD